jgi:AcrR family transcriptional regulator
MSAKRRRVSRAERQAKTRGELLATAAQVFARRGYHAASVEEIAEEAGYSHGAVYSNFDSKADLFLAVFEEYMAGRARELATTSEVSHGPLPTRARALADQWMDRFAKDRESFMLHMEFIAHASRDPDLAERFGGRSAALRDAVARYIEDYTLETGIALALPPDELALVLRALGIGLAVEALTNPAAVRHDLYGDFVELLIGFLTANITPAKKRSPSTAARKSQAGASLQRA